MSSVWYFPPWSFYISLNKSVCLMHTARGEINGSRLQCWIARDEEVSGTLIKGAEIPRRSSSFSLFDLICQQQWGEKKKRGLESGCWNSGGETGLHMPVCVRKPPNWHVWSGREQPHLVSWVFFFPEWQRSVKKCPCLEGHVSNRKPQEVFGGGRRKTLWDQWPLAARTRV